MALIGNISIGTSIAYGSLKKGIEQTGSLLGAITSPLGQFAVAMGAALSINKMEDWVKGSLEAVHATDLMASKIGMTTGELQGLQYAAGRTGTDAETLDAALLKMSANLGHAAMNGGKTAEALAGLGLDAKYLSTLDPAKAFQLISEKISQIQNPALQAATAMDIFGKSGTQLLGTFRAGPEKLAALTAEAQKMGLVLDDVGSEKMHQASASIADLTFMSQGLVQTMAAKLSPVITASVDLFKGLLVTINDNTTWIGWFAEEVGSAVDFVGKVLRNLGSYFEIVKLTAQQALGNVIAIIETWPADFGLVFEWLKRNWFNMLTDWVSMWKSVAGNLLENVKILGASIGNVLGSLDWDAVIVTPIVNGFNTILEKATSFGQAIWAAIKGQDWSALFSADIGSALHEATNTNFEFKPLLDGFKSTTEKFPDMVKPEWVDMSQDIATQFDKIAANEQNHADDLKKKALEHADKQKGTGDKTAELKDQGPKFAGVAELGSKEAYSAIVKFQGQTNKNEQKALLSTAKETLALQKAKFEWMKSHPGQQIGVYAPAGA